MFNASILELESQIQYHQKQQELAEQELDRLKMVTAFAEDATDKVSEALEHIDEKYISVFKEHLLSLFGERDDIEYMDDSHPDYKSIEELQQEEPDTVVAVFHGKEHVESQEEKKKKSYYELTGRPDLRPTQYEDLAQHITYSSEGRAYIGFDDRQEAEKFRESLDIPSMLDKSQIMNKHKWEVKFYCDREYLEELENDWTDEQKAELDFQEQLVRIAPDIFYDPSTTKCYIGFSSRERASTYGAHLKEIHELYDSRYTVGKSKVITNCKWELVLESITKDNAVKLAPLNLKKDLDYKTNKTVTTTWKTEKTEKEEVKKSNELATEDFAAPPYQKISLDEVEVADIVSTGEYVKAYYEVRQHNGTHLLCTCLHHNSLPMRIGQDNFYIVQPFLVERADSQSSNMAA